MEQLEHEVRCLADMKLIAVTYGHFPEPFLHRFPVTIHLRGVDKVGNSLLLRGILDRHVHSFGWRCPNLPRLVDLAFVASALEVVRHDLLPLLYDLPTDRDLLKFLRTAGFLVRALGMTVENHDIQTATNSISHRMVFTAERAAGWEQHRIKRRIIAHYGEISLLMDRQVLTDWNCAFIQPSTEDSVQLWWATLRRCQPQPRRRGLDSLFALALWNLWKERNARLFEGSASLAHELAARIDREAQLWILAGAARLGCLKSE